MAERIRLSIPAGGRQTHTLLCRPSETSQDGTKDGGGGRLGKLEWTAVVLDERIVDLEVQFLLRPKEDGGETTMEWLQPRASGGNFWGSFVPAEHPKMRQEMPDKLDRLEAIVFEFDNSYSWWTPKEVELICLREAEPVSRPPAPLPRAPQPASLTPWHPGSQAEGIGGERRKTATDEAGPQTQVFQMFTPPSSPREEAASEALLRAPNLRPSARQSDASPGARAADVQACQILAQLDAWLAAAEVLCPTRREGVEVLVGRISELRGFCKQKRPDVFPS